jgi:hypothetical protein
MAMGRDRTKEKRESEYSNVERKRTTIRRKTT